MTGKIGDQISVESQRVGSPPREGEILAVVEHPSGVSYRVRWSDGHETLFRPSAGSARILPARKRRSRKRA